MSKELIERYVYAFAEAMYAEGRKIEREEDQHEEAGHEND